MSIPFQTCSRCGRWVPPSTKPGDHCPHCNILFVRPEGANGEEPHPLVACLVFVALLALLGLVVWLVWYFWPGPRRWAPHDDIEQIAFSPEGERAVSSHKDGSLTVWEVATGKEVFTIQRPVGKVDPRKRNQYSPHPVAYAPDGKVIASGAFVGEVRLWDAETGEQAGSLAVGKDTVYRLAYSRDGSRLAFGTSEEVQVWDVARRKSVTILSPRKVWYSGWHVALSPDGKLVVGGSGPHLRAWDADSGKQLWQEVGNAYKDGFTAVAFFPDGKGLAVQNRGRTEVRHAADGSVVRTFAGWPPGALARDGARVVNRKEGNKPVLRLWDARTGEEVRSWPTTEEAVRHVAISPNGRLVLTGGNKALQLWDAESGKPVTPRK